MYTILKRQILCLQAVDLSLAWPWLQGLVFYITPGVTPPVEELKKVIESAGGAVLKRRPSAKTTTKMRDDKVRNVTGESPPSCVRVSSPSCVRVRVSRPSC